MCYHKSLNVTAPELEARYEASLPSGVNFQPVYHANAYQLPAWPILTRQEPGKFQMMHWGLIPHWARNQASADEIRQKTINARAETIYEKPSYRSAAESGRRCLIPITGFYEWHTIGKQKFPFYVNASDRNITSVAGLWDGWSEPGYSSETGEGMLTYTLLTTDANPLLAAIHNTKQRMPCLLTAEAERAWLHDDLSEADVLQLLADAYPANRMHSHAIGKRITSRTEPSDVPDVLKPVEYAELKDKPALFT